MFNNFVSHPFLLIPSPIHSSRAEKKPRAIAFHGNVVALWEGLAELAETEKLVDLGSDQTSLHNPFGGGYYPVQLGFEEAKKVLEEDPGKFKLLVQESLRRQVAAINKLCTHAPDGEQPMRFWDYGNAFLLEAARAGADILVDSAAATAGGGGGGGGEQKQEDEGEWAAETHKSSSVCV